jgi:hypothetical protein
MWSPHPSLQHCTMLHWQTPAIVNPAADGNSQATVASPADTAKTHRMAGGSPILVRVCLSCFHLADPCRHACMVPRERSTKTHDYCSTARCRSAEINRLRVHCPALHGTLDSFLLQSTRLHTCIAKLPSCLSKLRAAPLSTIQLQLRVRSMARRPSATSHRHRMSPESSGRIRKVLVRSAY